MEIKYEYLISRESLTLIKHQPDILQVSDVGHPQHGSEHRQQTQFFQHLATLARANDEQLAALATEDHIFALYFSHEPSFVVVS